MRLRLGFSLAMAGCAGHGVSGAGAPPQGAAAALLHCSSPQLPQPAAMATPSSDLTLLPEFPLDAEGMLRLAAQSMFDVFARTTEGMMVVDKNHRIVWISEGYKRFLPALGFGDETDFVGHRVEDVVPNTLMA